MPPTPSENRRGRFTRLEGIGMVPSRPRSYRHHDIYRPSPHTHDVPSRLRSTPGETEERSSTRYPSRSSSSSTGLGSLREQWPGDPFRSNVPDYQFPTQYLMAGFARRQTILQEQGARQQVHGQHRRRETAPHIDHTNHAPLALQQNESAGENEQDTQRFSIKREVSETSDGEAVLKSVHEYFLPTKLHDNMSDSDKEPGVPEIPVVEDQLPPEPPRPPSRLPHFAGRLAPDCLCPISLECPARENTLIDCRTLVLDYKKWEIRERAERVPE